LKRIGLISDTHGYIDDRIIEYLNPCDEIWHAGDIGSIAVLETLERLKPLKAVYGNIDDQIVRSSIPEVLEFFCEETKVLMKHIGGYPNRYDKSVAEKLKHVSPKLFISGHSHILRVMYDQKLGLLHINPGAVGKSGIHKVRTLVRFTIDKTNICDLEAIELETRW
jgi:uncharacterized protein